MRKMIETVCCVVLGALTGLADDPTVGWWTGDASTDLSADANWEGGKRPTQASEAMGFKAQPSADYTLTLPDDLDFLGTPWEGHCRPDFKLEKEVSNKLLTLLQEK